MSEQTSILSVRIFVLVLFSVTYILPVEPNVIFQNKVLAVVQVVTIVSLMRTMMRATTDIHRNTTEVIRPRENAAAVEKEEHTDVNAKNLNVTNSIKRNDIRNISHTGTISTVLPKMSFN